MLKEFNQVEHELKRPESRPNPTIYANTSLARPVGRNAEAVKKRKG